MNKKNIIVLASLAAVIALCCIVLLTAKDSSEKNIASSIVSDDLKQDKKETSADDVSESQVFTVEQDDGSVVSVEIGVAEMSDSIENEQSAAVPTSTPVPAETAQPLSESATDIGSNVLKWEEFYALSPKEMDAYMHSFGDMEAFYEWMIAAQAQFRIDYPDIEIGPGGSIDLSKIN